MVCFENGFQASFIERTVMCYQRESGNLWSYFDPDFRKGMCPAGILVGQSVDLGVPIAVIVGVRTDEPVYLLFNDSVPDYYHTHTAYAGAFSVGCFKINGCEIFHNWRIKLLLRAKLQRKCRKKEESGSFMERISGMECMEFMFGIVRGVRKRTPLFFVSPLYISVLCIWHGLCLRNCVANNKLDYG